MLSREEIHFRFQEGNISLGEGLEIILSYIYLRKGKEISIIPPRNPHEMMLFNAALSSINQWAA
jgi:hypothetical protein